MLNLAPVTPGLLFASFLYRTDLSSESDLRQRFENLFGASLYHAPKNNPLVRYYEKEMGPGLARFFLIPSTTFPRESILMAKLLALDWEREWSKDGKRYVNLDIGFLSLENFILATTKNYSHRIFLGQSIYADLTYQYVSGKYEALPWTYPDYQDSEKLEFFTWLRAFLQEKSQADARS